MVNAKFLWVARTFLRQYIGVLGVACALKSGSYCLGDDSQASLEFFESKVRPLLLDKCLECHSHQTETSGGLSLDSKEDWIRGGDSGQAIAPEQWEKSLFWKAVSYRDPHLQMPPHGKLSDKEIDILKQWLATGATDPRSPTSNRPTQSQGLSLENAQDHWAYQPVAQFIDVPIARDATTPIDAFLSVDQSRVGFEPAPLANDEVIRRRLFLDLLGINPPGFVLPADSNNSRPESYEKLVDELLASPGFGEHFARHWMDTVRFAESITLRGFVLPDAWRYRAYLIDAFNTDRPIDQFIQEQIAGDLMDSSDWSEKQTQYIAASMLVLGDTNLEEQDKKQLEMDFIDEQIDVLGKALLAQTISCARCHDHKFDPIPTSDYYALAGILKSSVGLEHDNVSRWVTNPLPLEAEKEKEFQHAEARSRELKSEIDRCKKELASLSGASSVKKSSQLAGIVVDDSAATLVGAWKQSTFHPAYVDHGYLHDGNNSMTHTASFKPNELPPGRYQVRIAYAFGDNRATNVNVKVFSANGEDVKTLNQKIKPPIEGLWYSLGDYLFEQGGRAEVEVSNAGANGHVIIDAVQFLSTEGIPATPVSTGFSTSGSTKSEAELKKQLEALEKEWNEFKQILAQRPMAMGLKPDQSPKDLAVHVRGSVHQLGPIVPRGYLRCLPVNDPPAISTESNGRLELARWITSKDNPLTARVYVNRIWSKLMGSGIVRTVDNFGTTGEMPSNHKLLDWLTIEFMRRGWSTKWLVREIVLSNAYRRSSIATSQQIELDPDNRTYARAMIRRLAPEAMRDSLLLASGELDLEILRGSSFPASLKEDYAYQHSSRYRTVYGPWFRNSVPELYKEFDGPNTSFSVGVRNVSTTAPQALVLLNSPWIDGRCRKIAARILSESNEPASIVFNAYHLILHRSPSPSEHQIAEEILGAADEESVTSLTKQLIASLDFRLVE
ncbi:MAG: DUF1553 domain-containing protein [Pirellula sp.]